MAIKDDKIYVGQFLLFPCVDLFSLDSLYLHTHIKS